MMGQKTAQPKLYVDFSLDAAVPLDHILPQDRCLHRLQFCARVDAVDRLTPVGTIVGGRSMFNGCFAEPDATSQACLDGWMRTGDLGHGVAYRSPTRCVNQEGIDVVNHCTPRLRESARLGRRK